MVTSTQQSMTVVFVMLIVSLATKVTLVYLVFLTRIGCLSTTDVFVWMVCTRLLGASVTVVLLSV